MNKNGKLFGKISIVDALVVIAVIIVAAGVYVRFFGGPTKTVVQSSTFKYTALVRKVRESNVDALKKSIGGNTSLDEKITGDMGTLLSVEEFPATEFLKMADGSTAAATVPDRYDVLLTFEINGKVNEDGYFSSSLDHISAGVQYNLKTKWSTVTAIAQRVWQD